MRRLVLIGFVGYAVILSLTLVVGLLRLFKVVDPASPFWLTMHIHSGLMGSAIALAYHLAALSAVRKCRDGFAKRLAPLAANADPFLARADDLNRVQKRWSFVSLVFIVSWLSLGLHLWFARGTAPLSLIHTHMGIAIAGYMVVGHAGAKTIRWGRNWKVLGDDARAAMSKNA